MVLDPALFLDLHPIAGECVCVCIQPDLLTKSLVSLGFLEILSAVEFDTQYWKTNCWTSKTKALIILTCHGDDTAKLLNICHLLVENESSPALIVVLMPHEGLLHDTNNKKQLLLIDSLQEQGCDDVMSLSVGERVTSMRVRVAMNRTEKEGGKLQDILNEFEAKTHHALHVANHNFLWNLPGTTLENIPSFDKTLDEWAAISDLGTMGGMGAYEFKCVLGEGSFGCVYKSVHPQKGLSAIKVISKKVVKGAHNLVSLDREFGTICNLPAHPNVVHAHEVFHGKKNLYIIMGYAGRRTLHDYQLQIVNETGTTAIPAHVAENFCKQVLNAVMHLHNAHVCHRDLKPANFILSDDDCTLQLSDFGFAMLVYGPGQLLGEVCGSFPFIAPEVLEMQTNGQRYDGFHSDAWSLAINLYELFCGPFSTEKILGWVPRAPSSIHIKIKDIKFLGQSVVSSLPVFVPSGIRSAIAGMLKVSPEARWSVEKALGPEGLNAQILHVKVPCAPCGHPKENRGPRAFRTMNCAAAKGACRKVLESVEHIGISTCAQHVAVVAQDPMPRDGALLLKPILLLKPPPQPSSMTKGCPFIRNRTTFPTCVLPKN